MTITTLSSRKFNQATSEAKKAASNGPVIITDRGRPSHVLMTFQNYLQLTEQRRNIIDELAMSDEDADIDFEPGRSNINTRSVDF